MEVDVLHREAHEDPTETMTFPKVLGEKERASIEVEHRKQTA